MKKIFAGMMAAAFTSFALMPLSVDAADANRFTLSDLVKVSQYLAGRTQLTQQQIQEFDLTGDGKVTLSDLVQMARDLQGESAPIPSPTQAPADAQITLEQAQQLALERVPGAVQSNIVSSQMDDTDLGIEVYEIELHHNGVRYDYSFSRAGDLVKESIEWPYDPDYQGSAQTEQSAQQVALGAVPGAEVSDITGCRPDTDDGVQVYDVDLVYNEQKWSFEIAQATGQILEQSMELLAIPALVPTTPTAAPSSEPAASATASATPVANASSDSGMPTPSVTTAVPDPMLSAQQAQQIVVDRIPGASLSNITSTKQDMEDGIPTYEIEVQYNGAEYECEITASGMILKESMERPVTPDYPGTQQTEQSAKDIAVGFVAGAAATDVTSFRLDTENGVPIYDIHLTISGENWSFEIVQATGEIISWSMETFAVPVPMPSATTPAPTPQVTAAAGSISRDDAIAAALSRVPGATAANVIECDIDTDHGKRVYEIEIRYNGVEYDVTVNAATGEVVFFHADHDD